MDLTTKVQIGEEMEAKVIKLNDGVGMVSLSYKRMAADRGNKRLEEAFENQEVLTAKVAQVLDGGLSVEVEGARVFIPASLYLTAMRRTCPSMQDRILILLSQNSILREEESSATGNSFWLHRRRS